MPENPSWSPADWTERDRAAARLLSSGGDARITLDEASGLNRYHSAPYPRDVVAYASSTANDISPAAFAHVRDMLDEPLPRYSEHLARLRERIRAAYDLGPECGIVFAASGTDLEYVALAAIAHRQGGRIHNILLGADEVGSGCIHSAHGRFFAEQTARGIPSVAGDGVPGLGDVSLVDIAVRQGDGTAFASSAIASRIEREIAGAIALGRYPLVHVVHGSKTGLILPSAADLAQLVERWRGRASFIVDACQARMNETVPASYLAQGCIVFVTGSKFMGGPPFAGFALVPAALADAAEALPSGFAALFRRAEWPHRWPGAAALPEEANPGLALRLEAAIFELERYVAVAPERRMQVVRWFQQAVAEQVVAPLGLRVVLPHHPDEPGRVATHPTAMCTLATLDIGMLRCAPTFEAAQDLHRAMMRGGVRLGQPVKCVRRADGSWGGTLRIGLSMPQIVGFAAAGEGEATRRLAADMALIRRTLAEYC